jgi:amino acid adenylation domain-containing protein
MSTPKQARDHWRGILAAGDVTTVSRWTRHPMAGVAEHVTTIPHSLLTDARRLADERGASRGAVLLAAHAKVLSVLSAEPEVTTGYVAGNARGPLPCRVATGHRTWEALVREAGRAEHALLSHRDFPVDDLARELGRTGPLFEVEFDPADGGGDLAPGTVLRVAISTSSESREPAVMRLRYRTDVVDADFATRLAGYHLTALAQLVADPSADHRGQSLLSAEELHLQVEGLAGPRRGLPDRGFHELFEQRVTARPDAVAAICGGRQWTYRELSDRSSRLARALIARGLRREDVVAVVTERNLDWMAAVLAVFKAGGAYLPVEPHFPPDRIATILGRAGCQLVLTEPGSTAALDQALGSLPGVETLLVDAAYAEEHPGHGGDPGVAVTADQLAYIYFTSGSTGEPKGAMCEHAGLLNHLSAKIDDLGIGEGDVVAQTAPQCFDISLWQLVSALLAGGRTLIVEQEVILDVERFVDTIVNGRVSVLQVVPSYLDTVLACLEQHPRPIPDLRCVSVTGEALTTELARRWFDAFPGVALVNAYGLTETSDDTNHEVMDRAPDRPRVPLGRPVNNVYVYVVDEHLSPVPLGAPGEIVFSGVCVGRGYVNDPERTRQAFLADPLRPGQRLYRSGDHGRWLPDGRLEFLGRRDTQVKLSGFRIEIGEVEGTLARTPGVRQSAVVVAEPVPGRKQLVAFCTGRPPDPEALRRTLRASLPEYMIPSAFHWRDSLPLTANGKVDRATLRALAERLDASREDVHAPRTPAEHRLASAWATVLGVPRDQIDRRDHFFERGGTSLSAVKLVVNLSRAVSVENVIRNPVLADLARLVDAGDAPSAEPAALRASASND